MAKEAIGKTEQIHFNSEMIDHFLLSPFHFFYIFCIKKVVILRNMWFNIKHVNKNFEFYVKVWFNFLAPNIYFFIKWALHFHVSNIDFSQLH